MDITGYFSGKRVTVMGLGLLGGVGDIVYLAEHGAELIVTDLKSEEEARPTLNALKRYPNIRYTLGCHELADFRGRDLIIKAPTTPIDSPYIAEARKEGTEITMWAALFSRFARSSGATIVGVTGTRGKTTVAEMLVAILRAAGSSVIEGGNLRGTALLPRIAEVGPETIVVLELDSWKLQGFGEAQLSPQVSVFTTFYDDHLTYYKGDRVAYLADKATIFLYQSEEDTFIMGKQCAATIIEAYGEQIKAKTQVVDAFRFPDSWTLPVPGLHNRYNAALALAAARVLGIDDAVSRDAFKSFAGVPGRLELLTKKNGLTFYNDTTATTPEATIAALYALSTYVRPPRSIILIMGGADKGLDMSALVEKLSTVKKVVFLSGTGTDKIKDAVPHATVHDSLETAFKDACASAVSGDTILFSPAFASFGMFKNEYDRGDQFVALVRSL